MIFIVLLLVFIVLVLCFKREHFNSNLINFLSIENTCKELYSIKHLLKYNINDINTRNINTTKYNELYKYYCDNLLEFNKKDKLLINWLLDVVYTNINKLSKVTNKNWNFLYNDISIAKYEYNIENGYPHTHKNIIFVHQHLIDDILNYYNNNDKVGALKNIGSVIFHELIHIWQRRDIKYFETLYTKYWSFKKASKIINGDKYSNNTRFNPDGPNLNWVLSINNTNIWVLSLYKKDAKNIGDVVYKGIYLKELSDSIYQIDNTRKIQNLDNIDEYEYYFHNINGNHYHPNELSAELMSIYFLKTLKYSYDTFSNNGYKNMLVWLKYMN